MNNLKRLHLCAVFGAAILAMPGLPAAEPGPDAPRRPGPPPGDFGRGQRVLQGQPRAGGVPIEAVLTPDQRLAFRDEMNPQRERLRELEEKQATLRREFEEALFAEKLDEKLVREKSTAMAEVEAERSLIRARAFARIRPSMSEEQLERLKTMRADAGRGPRMAEGGFRRLQEGGPGPGPDDRGERPRRPRPPDAEDEREVLPPPAPPRPPASPAPAPR
jgi:Spy/CpxP family protein refolding chaperone